MLRKTFKVRSRLIINDQDATCCIGVNEICDQNAGLDTPPDRLKFLFVWIEFQFVPDDIDLIGPNVDPESPV